MKIPVRCFGSMLVAVWVALPAFSATIVTWPGSTAEWNRKLGVEELRLGCQYEPERCLASMRRKLKDEGEAAATIAIIGDPQKVVRDAAEYSAASLKDPRLRGVGMDDFVSVLTHWGKDGHLPDGASATMQGILDAAKRLNPQLTFGITLYENELSSALIKDAALSPAVRAGIGRVTLYLHYRENGARYAQYVSQVRKLFPNAKILAGIYAYDRIDYSPCAVKGGENCSPQRELSLFQDALHIQMSLLARGAVEGVELYPGYYGAEHDWRAWSNPRICKPQRREECIETTLKMREMVVQAMQQSKGSG